MQKTLVACGNRTRVHYATKHFSRSRFSSPIYNTCGIRVVRRVHVDHMCVTGVEKVKKITLPGYSLVAHCEMKAKHL